MCIHHISMCQNFAKIYSHPCLTSHHPTTWKPNEKVLSNRDPPFPCCDFPWFSMKFLIWQNNCFPGYLKAKPQSGWFTLHSAPDSSWGSCDNKITLLVAFCFNVSWFICFGSSLFFFSSLLFGINWTKIGMLLPSSVYFNHIPT